MYLPADLWLICTIFIVLGGACIGSFLNVCIYRIPLDQSVVAPRSHCMTCGSLIPWYHNIPVLSYFALRGRCGKCRAPYSFRYAAVELLTAFMFALVCIAYPPEGASAPFGMTSLPCGAAVFPALVFISGLIIGTFVDFDHFIIPDSITIGGMAVGLIFSGLVPSMQGESVWWKGLLSSFGGLCAGVGILIAIAWIGEKIFKKEAMGFGDVKLLGAIGAFWGWKAALFSLVAASFIGTIAGVSLIILGKTKLGAKLPFGPYLSLGSLISLFWGEALINWYLSIFSGFVVID